MASVNGLKTPMIRPRSLTAMMLETARSVGESAITSVLMWAWACVREVFTVVTAHRAILALLGASVLYNVLVVTQGSSAFWAERKAAAYMSRIGVGPNTVMSRAIYLADLEEASQGTGFGGMGAGRPTDSPCYETFQAMVNTTDIDGPSDDAGATLSLPSSQATARRLRRARQRLGTHRHDLLVAMRVVNGIEAVMVQSEWENWLADENGRCERVGLMLRYSDPASGQQQQQQQQRRGTTTPEDTGSAQSTTTGARNGGVKGGQGSDGGDPIGSRGAEGEEFDANRKQQREALKGWYDEYCASCESDQKALMADRHVLM